MKSIFAGAIALLLLVSLPVTAEDIRQERVQFKPGETGATIKGRLKGDQTVDYLLQAKAGQSAMVMLKSSNRFNYFNVMAPGSDTAIFIGSTSGNRFEGELPKDGEYVVRVYLMRNAARRGEAAQYSIHFGVSAGK